MRLKWNLPKNMEYYPYLVDLLNNNHVLIAGTTGSGKSVLENDIIYSLLCCKFPGENGTQQNAHFIFFDPKKVELRFYNKLPHCLGYADNIKDIIGYLRALRVEVDNRLQSMIKKGLRKSDKPPLYIFIDELVDLMTSKEGKEITRLISDIISISRATNIFFVMCTQAPNRKILKPEIILNCNCRIALKCNDKIESRQIIGISDAADLPPHGIGIVSKDIEMYKIKIPLISDDTLKSVVDHWNKQNKLYMFFRNLK